MDNIEVHGDLPLALWLDCIQGDTDKEAKVLDELAANCSKAIWHAEHYEKHEKTGEKRRRAIRKYLGYAFRRGQKYTIRKAAKA